MAVVSDVEIRLRADIARLRQDLSDARREVTGALNSMSASAEAFKGLLGGIATGLSVGAFVSFIKQSIDAADALNDMSVRTKVAIEDLAGLAYAAKLGDTSLEGVAGAISKLGMNIGKDGAKFRELGITATEPLEAFKQLADVFKNIQDPQQRAAFGAEALGKSWQEAAVLLDGGSEGIATLIARGQELSGITKQITDDAGVFNDKLDELGFAAQGVGTRIAAGLLPTLQKIADSFSANAVNGRELEGVITVLSGTFKALYSVGVGISALFVGLGKSIGGTAAVAVAALSGDFTGALQIYKTMAADVYSGLGDAAIQIAKVWVDTGKSAVAAADAGDEMADRLIANATAIKVATFLSSADIAGARDKAAAAAEAAAKKEQSAYAGLVATIKEKIAVDQAEVAGGAALTDSQKLRIKIDQELAAGKIVLTAEHIKELNALLDSADAMAKNAAAAKQVRAAVAALADERDQNYKSLVSEADANEELIRAYGKTKLQILELTQARDLDRLSQRGALELSEDTVAQLEREIEVRKRSIAAMGTLEVLDKQKKATDEAAAAQVSFWKSIDDTAHATFVSIANGSKDTAQRLKDTFKNVFFDWLYQQTLKKWIINIGTATSGSAASGLAGVAGLGGSGGSAVDLISMGKKIYDGFTTGFAGVGSALGGYVTTLGNLFGSSATSAFGAGMGLTSSQAATAAAAYNSAGMASTGSALSAGSTAGAAAGVFAGVAGGVYGGRMISGGYGSNSAVNTGTAIGAVVGSIIPVLGTALGALIGGAIGGVWNRTFGRKAKEVTGTRIEGSLSPNSATATVMQDWLQKGGWFKSDKRGTDSQALGGAELAGFSDAYKSVLDLSKAFGDVLGVSTDSLAARVQKLSIDLTGLKDAAAQQEAVAKFFSGVADTIAGELVPGLAKFSAEGETMAATLQRLAVDYQSVDNILKATGQSIKLFGVAGIEARENLIAAAGGLDKLSTGVGYFMQNFLSSSEQLAPVQKQLADALAAMGMSALKTNDQFKAAVLGIDLNTKAGAELYVQMLALAPAFKQVTDATEAAAKAAADAAIATAQASAAAEAERLRASEEALRAGVTAALDAAKDAIAARKDELKASFDTLMSGFAESISNWTGKITEIKSLQSLLSGARITGGQNAASRGAAQSELEAALKSASSSGILPSADSLRDAISAVSASSADQFGTLIEYQRDQARASRSIAGLSSLTDDQLTTAEKTLLAIQNQKASAEMAFAIQNASLDSMLAVAQRSAEIELGTYQATLGVQEGLATVAAAIAALKAGPTPSNPGGAGLSVAGLYQSVLGRDPMAEGLKFWTDQFGAVVDSDEYAKFISAAGAELEAKANGTWAQWLGANGAGSAMPSGGGQASIDTLNTNMANMQSAMARTAAATTKLAEQFDQVSGGGNALYTETA